MATHALEADTVVIGSSTENGRKRGPVPDFRRRDRDGHRPGRVKTQPLMVDIISGEKMVGEIDLITLVRFSKLAAGLFPRSEQGTRSRVVVAANKAPTRASPASFNVDTVPVDPGSAPDSPSAPVIVASPMVSQLKAGATPVLTFPIKPAARHRKNKPTPAVVDMTSVPVPVPITQERKLLDLSDYCTWQAPSPRAVKFVLDWMRNARPTPRNQTPLPCAVSNPSLAKPSTDTIVAYDPFLCEVYAVTVILDLRPTAYQARQDLMTNITAALPTLEMLKHIHAFVQVEDHVMSRVINVYFDRVYAVPYLVDEKEIAAIHEYVSDKNIDDKLFQRFKKAQDFRERENRRARAAKAAQGRQGGQDAQANLGGSARTSSKRKPGNKWKKGSQMKQGAMAKSVQK